jgi:anaphase-promoting complex subunit 8
MRNTAAAIEAYRRALDINARDYRAWYGLGQTYEILQMHFYSLHYFRKATALRPYDARMWCAMGQSYECLEKYPEAIKCYKRAHENGDREGISLNKLAKLYADVMRDDEQAAVHYLTNLELLDAEQVESQQTMDALMFLARYYKEPKHNRLDDAELYCQRLQEHYGADKEEVAAWIKEIREVKKRLVAQQFQVGGAGLFSSPMNFTAGN